MTMRTTTGLDHRETCAAAWADPSNTRFEIPPIDVNRVLEERYETAPRLEMTRGMLWEVEVRKAWHPDLYIPHVVRGGSAGAWARHRAPGDVETFVRKSMQRLWLQPGQYGLILEQTHLSDREQKVTFIGA